MSPELRFDTRRWLARAAGLSLAAALATFQAGCGSEPPARAETTAAPATADSLEYPQWETLEPGQHVAYNQRTSLVQRGRLVYESHCVGCHGERGDGEGPASARLLTQPRDFTRGIFKFRSTDSSSLPLDSDLYRVITLGLDRVSMPAFPLMAESDKVAVIQYIKTFYPEWEARKAQNKLVPVPQEPAELVVAERVARGRVVYMAAQCWKCHGVDGRGTGATQTDYTDAWGNQQAPFDFTRGGLKGGKRPEDIYRTFHAGLRSVMPSFGGDTMGRVTAQAFAPSAELLDAAEVAALEPAMADFPADSATVNALSPAERRDLAERNSWDLVAYILSLRTETSTAEAVLGAASSS